MAEGKQMVKFRGTMVAEGWPEELSKEQKWTFLVLGKRIFPRIRCHEVLCHDCCATVGEVHAEGCDMERCPLCHGQLLSCGCNFTKKSSNMGRNQKRK